MRGNLTCVRTAVILAHADMSSFNVLLGNGIVLE